MDRMVSNCTSCAVLSVAKPKAIPGGKQDLLWKPSFAHKFRHGVQGLGLQDVRELRVEDLELKVKPTPP